MQCNNSCSQRDSKQYFSGSPLDILDERLLPTPNQNVHPVHGPLPQANTVIAADQGQFPADLSLQPSGSNLIFYDAASSAVDRTITAGPGFATRNLEGLAQSKRCVRCWVQRKQCITDHGQSICSQCIKFGLPPQVCSRVRITQYKPFEKWKNQVYETLFTSVQPIIGSSPRMVGLRQYPCGPTLHVECCEFLPSYSNEFHVLLQNSSGWHPLETTSFCLSNPGVDISSYVRGCVPVALKEARSRQNPVAFFFVLAQFHLKIPIIQQCLEMYTTLRLMTIKWKFSSNESLGMAAVEDINSAWFGITPVPRMVQNQLGHLLELNMIELDMKISKQIQELMDKRVRRTWVVVTLASFLLLHIRELDAGRIIFWSRYRDPFGFWIHPSQPKALIDEAVASCNSLLSHFHCLIGRKALNLNWEDKRNHKLVDNDQMVIKCMKVIQAFVLKLKDKGLIGREACNVYKDGDPNSVGFTMSSLLFESMKEGCEINGFC